MQLILIALGGACGALLRYGVSEIVQPARNEFPLATLITNISGAFLLGLLATLLLERFEVSAQIRVGITVGVLGAYTTFSTFSLETIELLNDGEWQTAVFYVVISVMGALLAVWAGQGLARA